MKTTKLYSALIYVLAFLVISISSLAQDKDSKTIRTPEEKAKINSERLKTSLNLSDDQYTKIYDLNLQRIKDSKEFREIKLKFKEDRDKKNTEYKNSLKSILTDDQIKSMKTMHKDKKIRKEHRNKRHQRR